MDTASDLISLVQLQLKGCPEPMAAHGLRRALARICAETGCWRRFIETKVSGLEEQYPGTSRFAWPSKTGDAWILRAKKVTLSKLLADATFGEKSELDPALYALERREKTYLSFLTGANVADGDSIEMDAVLVPNEAGSALSDIPESIAQTAGPAAVHLAVHLLAAMGGRPWTDAKTEISAITDYRRAKAILLHADLTGGTPTAMRSVVEGLVE